MADPNQILRSLFTTELVVILILMVFNTYFLARRPILHHLREIYFVNSPRFKRAWYLVIAAMTNFVVAQSVRGLESFDASPVQEGSYQIFEVAFGGLIVIAFFELLLVFRKYIPHLGASDAMVEQHIRFDLRRSVIDMDELDQIDLDVSVGSDIYGGRPQLGPHVSLAHYRGVLLGITQYLEQRFGQLGDSILSAVGRQTGRQAARSIQEQSDTIDDTIDAFLHEMQGAGVGIPTIMQETPSRATIRVEESAVSAGVHPSGEAECHYLSGLFTGLYEAVKEHRVQTTETKCCAKGDAYCEFDIDLRPAASRG